MSLFLSSLLAGIAPLVATSPSASSQASPSAATADASAMNPSPPSLYYGIHVPGQLYDYSAITQMQDAAGKNASIVMLYQGWATADGAENFETVWMDNIRDHGSIPMVTWEPWHYLGGVNQPEYSLSAIIGGQYDAYITRFALDAKGWGHPFFLRFAHEMNGDWYPWSEGINGNTPGQYVRAWRHVHDLFTANGVSNVTWVWSPNIEYTGSVPLSGLYPGDAYTDWIAMDGYNWGATQRWKTWQTFSEVFGPTYAVITSLSQKPLLVAETASTEQDGDKSQWITSALSTEIFHYPRIKGFIWFNENKETDWRIESSPTAQAAFGAAVANPVYAGNSYSDLETSPIPPLE
jgi:beta-mannanase